MLDGVTIVITTYNRLELAKRTIRGYKKHLKCALPVSWTICDDQSDNHEEYVAELKKEIGEDNVHVVNGGRHGIGWEVNRAIPSAFDNNNLVLLSEDDWELRSDFDINNYIELLNGNDKVGLVRFGYLSAGLRSTIVTDERELYLMFNMKGDQYLYTGHPYLVHPRYFEYYGYFVEGVPPGQTELEQVAKYNRKKGPPYIVYPLNIAPNGVFHHIGSESLNTVQPK